MSYTKEHRDASRAVEAFEDKLVEAKRRWPDWEWEDLLVYDHEKRPVKRFIYARWSREGRECGLRTDIPLEATDMDIADAKEHIATSALFNAEMRKRAP